MATWDWDPATDQVTGSDTMDDLFGLRPGETLQSSAQGFGLVHPDDVDRHRELVEWAVERDESWHNEFRIIRPRDGAVAWLEERATAKRDPQAGMVYMTGIVWDITERKLAEEALRKSEERLQLAIDAAQLGRWELVPETGEFTFILVFVVISVATDERAPAAIAPIAVGFALAVGVFIAGPVTGGAVNPARRSEEHTSELQSRQYLVCCLLLENKDIL